MRRWPALRRRPARPRGRMVVSLRSWRDGYSGDVRTSPADLIGLWEPLSVLAGEGRGEMAEPVYQRAMKSLWEGADSSVGYCGGGAGHVAGHRGGGGIVDRPGHLRAELMGRDPCSPTLTSPRNLTGSGSVKCWRVPKASAWPGSCIPGPGQPSPSSGPGGGCAVPCALSSPHSERGRYPGF